MNLYPHLFSPLTIRGVTYKNRIFASPVAAPEIEDDGSMPSYHVLQYLRKAWGGCAQVAFGEIPVDNVYASREHKFWMDHIDYTDYNSPFMSAFSDYAKAIHDAGAVVCIQISHAGESKYPDPGDKDPIGPSEFVTNRGIHVHAMDEALMEYTCNSFANCAAFLKAAGFDSVQVHAGHGWLLHQFLSPRHNHRTDEYGGSIENRAKFPLRVLKAIRDRVGEDMIIEVRVSGEEYEENGLGVEETARFCQMAQEYVDLIQVSAGDYRNPVKTRTFSSLFHPHGCNVPQAEVIKKAVSIPVIVVGGLNDPAMCEEIIASGKADFVAFGRQMFADPAFANKAAAGKPEEINKCLRCFNCFPGPMEDCSPPPFMQPGPDGKMPIMYGPTCTINPDSGMEKCFAELPRAAAPKKVLIVGGGAAGMSAAVYAHDLGHTVTLIEKDAALGGLIRFADVDVHKSDIRQFKDDLIARMKNRKIDVRLNTVLTSELLAEVRPDAIFAAVGSSPIKVPIPGIDGENVLQALDAYYHPEKLGKKIVMIGGGLVGCELGLHLAETGHEVSIVEMRPELAPDAYRLHRVMLLDQLEKKTTTYTGLRCTGMDTSGVTAADADGNIKVLPADTIVYAMGMRANSRIVAEIQALAGDIPVSVIGDCKQAGKIIEATKNAYDAVLAL